MKRIAWAAAVIGVVLAISQPASATTYKWITFKPKGANDAQAISTQWLVDEFSKRTNGKHKIQVFWGGSVAKTAEVPDALAAGVGDFGDIITPYFPDRMPLNNAVGFFIPQPADSMGVGKLMEKWQAKYPQFTEELHKQGLHAFGFRPLESYGLLCTMPIKSMADLKGKRIRSYGFAYPALIEAMGATPVTIATAETYEALQRSVVDCTPIGPALARGWKYDEVAKYYIEVPFGASFGHLLAMNLKTYEGMDTETRAVVDKLGKDYLVKYEQLLDEDNKKVREMWKGKLAVHVLPFPRAELAAVISNPKIQAVREQWIKKAKAAGLPAEEIVNDLKF